MSDTHIPQRFIDFIQPHVPDHLSLNDFLTSCQLPLRKSIRVNTLKITVADFLTLVKPKGWQLAPVPWCDSGFWLTRPATEEDRVSLGNCFEHISGLFYIQEASSMLPPQALFYNQTSTEVILDVAAAPGSKSTQIAALMNNKGLLVANEYSASRLKVLFANSQRCGVSNIAITHMDGRLYQHLTEQFDAILLDAPCSGEGTVRKDPDSMKNWTEQSVHSIAQTQFELLESAFKALKVGGTLVYSTCTLNPFENQDVCLKLKARYSAAVEFESLANLFDGAEKSITEQGFLHVWPQIYDSEGFFVARIKKHAAIEQLADNPFKRLGKFPYQYLSRQEAANFLEFLNDKFAFTDLDPDNLYIRNNTIWYFPSQIKQLNQKVKFNRSGVRLAEIIKNGYKLDHSLAVIFSRHFNKQVIEVDEKSAQQYLMGQDFKIDKVSIAKGECVIAYQGQVLGFAKNLVNRFKNQLPRELVKDNIFDF